MLRTLALLGLLVVTSAQAWNVPTDITARPDYEVGARVARDNAGNIHLVWYGGVDSSSWEVFHQTWNGSSWSAPVDISSSAAAGCDVAVDGNGNVHAVWNAGGNPEDIYYRKRTSGVWGATVNLSTSSQRSLTPRVAVDSTGQSVFVVWHESGQNGANWDIFARRSNGGTWSPVENVSQDPNLSRNADTAIDSTGAFHLVWEDLDDRHLYHRKRLLDESYSARTVLDTTSGRSYGGSIAIGGNDHIHVAWHDDNDDWEIYYRRFNGTSWEVPINVSRHPDPDHADHSANVTTDADHQAHIVWSDYQNIYYAHTVAGVLRPGYRISPGSNQGDPVCLLGAGNVLHALWPSRDPGSWDIFHARHTLPDTSAPAALPTLRAIPANEQVRLEWSRSVSIDFSGVLFRWKTNGFPVSPTDGALATNAGPNDTFFIHRGLMNGVTYYYSAFAFDAEPNYTFASTVTAVPIAAPKTNLLVNPSMENGFANGVATGWTRYRVNDPNNAFVFASDSAQVDSPVNSQSITNLGATTLPATGYSAAGLYQVVTNVRPGAVYLFVGAQDIYTSDFGADGARYMHNFGLDPLGGTAPGASFDLGIVGAAKWMGPGRTFYNNHAGGSPAFGGFHRARAAFVAESNRVSVWTGVAVNNAATRDNVPTKFNTDTHYLFEFDFPTNTTLANGDFSGATTDLQNGGDTLPEGWLSAGGGVGQVNSWAVATNFARMQDAVNRGARIWSRRGMVNAGLMQRVAVAPGETVTWSAWARTSGQDNTEASVGIDPFGRGDLTSLDIVWFRSTSAAWTQLTVSATAQAPSVTVFLRTSSVQGGGNYQWSDFDDANLSGGGSPAVSLVSVGTFWKYLPVTNDLGTSWRETFYDDIPWSTGLAPLGYGDGDEATTVPFYQDQSGNNISTYFRYSFLVTNAPRFTNLIVRLLRDDGGVVHLNGVEVFRSNMPTGSVNHATRALVSAGGLDESVNFYATNVSPTLLREGLNVLAVEIHQSAPTSGDISFDLQLSGIANPHFTTNRPPTVLVTAPAQDTAFPGYANIAITADAFDTDGEVRSVEFFNGSQRLGEAVEPPFSVIWSNVPPGTYALTARATDDDGAEAISLAVVVRVGATMFIPSGSIWRYRDDGSDQGTAWRAPGFSDSAWAFGPAELGYGDAGAPDHRPEATVVNNGGLNTHYITTYFRHTFSVPEPSAVASLRVRLLRDDGGIVYLNGNEIFRSNMPLGPIDFLTLAASSVNSGPDETTYHPTNISSSALQVGENVLAVEIHQIGVTSTDISFDLELVGFPLETLPRLMAQTQGSDLLLSWPQWAGQYRLYCTADLTDPASWVAVANTPVAMGDQWAVRLPRAESSRFYRLQSP